MQGTRKISADLREICNAYSNGFIKHEYYLDLETGEVILILEDFIDDEETEELHEKIWEEYGNRYISIQKTSSREGYQDMEDFIETVEDPILKDKLIIAIKGKGAFSRFKYVLQQYPIEIERWYKFQDARIEERVMEWLQDEGIELVKKA